MMAHNSMNYVSHLEDEIALEGLDGITLEGLWLRLNLRHNFIATFLLDDSGKEFIWSLILQDEEIEFYCLPEPRPELKIFNRYEYIDSEVGLVLEPEEDFVDIYPCVAVEDRENGIRGSCATYKTRVNITEEVLKLSLEEAQANYGNKLIMVASQTLRDIALGINAAVDKFYDLRLMQYIMLERIGRSRTMGEITYGKNSLGVMQQSPKTMFYYRKPLLKLNLITKQSHRQRSLKGNISSSSLLHLARFYVIRRSKFILMIQQVVQILQTKRDFTCPLAEIKEEIGLQNISSKKVFKSSDFIKHVQSVMIPYRHIHPDATIKEWKCKSKNEEKMIRCLQLINPDMSIEDILRGEEEEEDVDEYDSFSGILDQSNIVYGKSLLQQAYLVIRSAGPEGLTQMELSKALGLSKLDSRTVCRGLQKRKVIHSLMKDIGRQRVTKFVSNKYALTGHLLQEYESERKKLMEFKESEQAKEPTNEEQQQPIMQYETATPSTSRIMDTDLSKDVEIGVEVSHSNLDLKTEDSNTTDKLEDFAGGEGAANNLEDGDVTITRSDSPSDDKEEKSLADSKSSIPKTSGLNSKRVCPHLTTRMIRRANIIIDAVGKFKVIDDAHKLQKMIITAEQNEGVEGKMDKKSLTRLLDKLAKHGYLKKILVTIQVGTKSRVITFVTQSNLPHQSSLMKMAILNQKHKFMVQCASSKQEANRQGAIKELKESDHNDRASDVDNANNKTSKELTVKEAFKQEPSVGFSVLEMEKMHYLPKASDSSSAKNDLPPSSQGYPSVGVKGSVEPKFVRMQKFHQLLFYLVYGQEGNLDLDQNAAWETILESAIEDLSSESIDDYPRIYVPELSWKMFISPLPKHTTVPVPGWFFMVDVLLRLPLSIFVHIVRVFGESTILEDYLKHPIKRNLLVKDLPPDLRRCLLNGRRYVTYVMELCNRLCFVGLLQKGTQIMKEKDQLFVYLNRRATLVDTTTSSQGYHLISVDKEYVKKEYFFQNLTNVIEYWYDMYTICMHTPLGTHMCVQGKKITIQVLHKKPEMIESLKTRGFEEAPEKDTGHIPGDERGAAGLDSAMFAHLKRNWSCLYARFNTINQTAAPSSTSDPEKNSNDAVFSYAQYLRNSCTPGSMENSISKNKVAGLRSVRLSLYKAGPQVWPPHYDTSEKEKGDTWEHIQGFQEYIPKVEIEGSMMPLPVSVGLVDITKKRKRETKKDQKIVKKSHGRDKSSYLREVKVRKKMPKKPYYDEEDKAALRRMNKLRVDWYPAEDSFLLLCKVSSAYLFPTKRTQIINFSVIRDLLHSRYPDSMNKTSKACQRRVNYIMKNPATEENVAVILEEIKQDEEITLKFKPATLSYKATVLHKLYANTFKELVGRLVTKYSSNESKDTPNLPDTYSEFESRFKIIRTSYSLKEGPKLHELTSVTDIDHYVVHALIFSSLCTKQDRESWAYQLYLAYQKYPQKLLNSVLITIRETKMISYKKCYNRSKYIRTCLPLSTSPFQLSLSFIYVFHMKYPFEIFASCWDMTKKFVNSKVEAVSKCSVHLPGASVDDNSTIQDDKMEGTLDTENTKDKVVEKPVKRRKKPRKIGIRAKSRKGARNSKNQQQQQKQQDQVIEQENQNVDNAQQNVEYLDLNLLESREKGVQLSNTVVGGECATVLSLAAMMRLSFDISVPDQLIAIDNQKREKDEDRSKLLEKIEYHEMVSGRKFDLSEELNKTWFPNDEDIYTEKNRTSLDPKGSLADKDQNLSSKVSGKNGSSNDSEERKQVQSSGSDKRKNLEESDTSSKKLKLTSDQSEEDRSNSYQVEVDEDVQKDVSQRPKQNSQSRIRMYMMREQMSDTGMSTTSYWAFDNIFISTCEISCKLRLNFDDSASALVPAASTDIAEVFMPISKVVVNDALNTRKKVVLNSWSKLETAISNWRKSKRDSKFLSTVKKLYTFIESKKELGATAKEIKEEFADSSVKIMETVREMEDVILILRVGVDTFRWVVIQFSKPWLIHTNKMSRAKMNSTDSVRLSGVYDVDDVTEEDPKPKRSRRHIRSGATDDEPKVDKNLGEEEGKCEGEETSPASTRGRKKSGRAKIALLKKSCPEDAEAAYKIENTYDHSQIVAEHEEIDVLVRPWVRLNGCLNRRVLDRMLGSVLCHVKENPGISGCQIAKKFWPAIQPAHTYELLETLMTIGTVHRSTMRKTNLKFLYDDDQDFEIGTVDDTDFDDNFLYEAEVDCVLKFATFIGDKKYSQEFLATCR